MPRGVAVTSSAYPDTGNEEKGTPRPPEGLKTDPEEGRHGHDRAGQPPEKNWVLGYRFHTAFDDPNTPPGAAPRESIETRVFAFF